jgi:hypothetical protein
MLQMRRRKQLLRLLLQLMQLMRRLQSHHLM